MSTGNIRAGLLIAAAAAGLFYMGDVNAQEAATWGLEHERAIQKLGDTELKRMVVFASCVYSYSRDNAANLAFSLNLAITANQRLVDKGVIFNDVKFDADMADANNVLLMTGQKIPNVKTYCETFSKKYYRYY